MEFSGSNIKKKKSLYSLKKKLFLDILKRIIFLNFQKRNPALSIPIQKNN